MQLRHAAALALVGWYLMTPVPGLAANAKSTLVTYTNEAYGFSFRYPNDCTLTEGNEVELDWGYSGPVGDSLVHGATVAAVELPFDPYHGTDFGGAFLKVSVDTSLTPTECNRTAFGVLAEMQGSYAHYGLDSIPQPKHGELPTVKIGAIQFTEAEEDGGGLGHQTFAEYYHVFRNRVCYEFQLGLGTDGSGSTDLKKVDDDAVFRRLEAILATVTIRPTIVAPLPPQEKAK
jgi:hypothetical protein